MISGRSGVQNGEFSQACELALRHMEKVRVLRVWASGEFLAEVPGYHWDFWALGRTEEEAKRELLRVISRKLQDRLGSWAKLDDEREVRS